MEALLFLDLSRSLLEERTENSIRKILHQKMYNLSVASQIVFFLQFVRIDIQKRKFKII